MNARLPRISAVAVLTALVFGGCADGSSPPSRTASPPAKGGWIEGGDRKWNDTAAEEGGTALAATGGAARASGVDDAATADAVASPSPASTSPPPFEDKRESSSGLRAGSVDDNDKWGEYLDYRKAFAQLGLAVRELDVSERHTFTVKGNDGKPVLGARIRISDGDTEVAELRTHADGTARFFPLTTDRPKASSYTAVVSSGDATTEVKVARDVLAHPVVLGVDGRRDVKLDVHFLIDTTGSMGDEIDRLKTNMISVAEQIAALPSKPDARFAMTVYRDRGDVFVTRNFDFTGDVKSFTAALREVEAGGGGDTPEDLNAGLHDALTKPAWRGGDTVSLVFLVADAAPHLDYDGPDYAKDVLVAAARGVKIHPIASSGLEDEGEYVFRQLAQITGGRFNFLTYGADGGPGDETTHHVEDYSVLSLDQLVVRLVSEELTGFGNGQ